MNFRQETERDYEISEYVVEEAFKNSEFKDDGEHVLVKKIRQSEVFVPELSIVAEVENKIVGHIMMSKVKIQGSDVFESIALEPVAVLPEYQKKGIGERLVQTGLQRAKELGFESVIVIGHANYYKKFGFEKASKWNIKCPDKVPEDLFMALELEKDSLCGKAGVVRYAKEFDME